ncbi:MAG: FAD-binding oxidoreductase [Gammaproteobacteria bacterium]
MQNDIVSELAQLVGADIVSGLAQLVGADIVVAPDAQNVVRHTRDYGVRGDAGVGILALAYPRTTQQIAAILKFCNERRIPVQPQGGMTGLAGGGVPIAPCVVVSLERMRAIREIDADAGTITVEAGVVMEAVQKAADAVDLFFPLDLGGRGSCQIGGNLSTNAGGNRVLRFGMARDLVLGVEAVLADGTVIDSLRKVIKNNTGYDMRQLFIGSEGTLGIITAAVLRLFPKARSVNTGLCAVADYDAVLQLLKSARAGFGPQLTAFEVMWPDFYRLATEGMRRTPPLPLGAGAYVLIETMGQDPNADQQHYESVIGGALEAGVISDAIVAKSDRETGELWAVRDSPGEWQRTSHWPQLSFDVSVSTGEIGALVSEIDAGLLARWPQLQRLYFGHVADGNLHLSVGMAGHAVAETDIEEVVYEIASRRRGSISAEHGIGSLKKQFLHYSRSPAELALMRVLKKAMDPNGILNPGKIF